MLEYVSKRIKGTIRFLRRVLAAYASHDSSKNAAALAYYTLFSIFPLLLFLVYAASLFFPSVESRRILSDQLETIFPYGAENLSRIIEQTWKARDSIGIVSGIGLLWGGSSIFGVLEISLSRIWESNPRSYIKRRLLGILAVLALVLTFVAFSFISPIASLLLDTSGINHDTVSYLMELVSLTIVMMLLYRIFPNETVHWGAAFSGAFSAAVLVMVTKFGFRIYTMLVIERNGLLYGSLTWFLTLALWVYLVGVLIFFGAEFAAAFQQRQNIIAAYKNKSS
jgi:membrane protein